MTEHPIPLPRREDIRIGATLRELWESRGYRVGEFASELGISHGYLCNIAAGRKRLTPPLLRRACLALNCRPIAIIRDGYFEDVAA